MDGLEGGHKQILSKAEEEKKALERKLDLEEQKRIAAEEDKERLEMQRKEDAAARERAESDRLMAEQQREKRLKDEEERMVREREDREEELKRAKKQREAEALLKKPASLMMEQQNFLGHSDGALSSPGGSH